MPPNKTRNLPALRPVDGNPYHLVVEDSGPAQPPSAALPGPDHLPARPARAQIVIEGSYSDRARGFSIATWQLSGVVAVAAVILSQLMFDYPLLSVATLAWLVGGFFVVWLAAFLLHTFVSAEGVEFLEAWRLWRYVEREQAERWRRYRGEPARRWSGQSILYALLGAAIFLALLLVALLVIGGIQ